MMELNSEYQKKESKNLIILPGNSGSAVSANFSMITLRVSNPWIFTGSRRILTFKN